MLDRKSPLITAFILLFGLSLCIAFYQELGFESLADLGFEGSTLILLIYIYQTAYSVFKPHRFLLIGSWLLLFNKAYDLLTEVPQIEEYADRFEVIDTILDDGSLFVAFVFIAIGVTHMMSGLIKANKKDDLTQLYNRKKLSEIPFDEFDLIYFDLNSLKLVNDLKGHSIGDLMLIRFAHALRYACHPKEMALRVGGDEFIAITHKGRANEFVEHVNKQLENEQMSFAYGIKTTNLNDVEAALISADKAMYQMKKEQKKQKITI
ncbi:sensor domain-containing diguanylate cyclase [Aliivibrio fischeri]|uniref:GGDEF domain-containing protein n=1 Tax=Aliivibrio fischeri TaxID=668 RepID=UPI0012D8FCBE|nr:GGDEF domain-containing protein [Aliivibrio fischeri]MUK70765.1 diguanylate cyclase [Aliivibrio fischeri]MUK74957.1 diguanylate cyclase [Aliivibrio fischeri]MUK75659.1 diguanylate cyclase [Aliivibrio fischeri]